MAMVVKAHALCEEHGAKRVLPVVKIEFRPGGVSIEEKIGESR